MKASEMMSTDLLVVGPDDNAYDLGLSMEKFHVGKAVVADDMEFLGVVSKETFVAHMRKHPDTNVKDLLVRDFMEADVYTVKPDEDVDVAVDLLMSQKSMIDYVPVVSSGKVKGLISSVDLVRVFAKNMSGRYRVSDLMHYNPLTVYDYTPLGDIIDAMKGMSEKRVLVLSGANLVGIVTMKDIGLTIFRQREKDVWMKSKTELKASDVMTRNLATISPRDDAAKAAQKMLDLRVGGLPVVRAGLEGLIDRIDLLKGYKLAR